MLTRDFRPLEERTRYPLKPLISHFLFPAPSNFTRLDIRLRRAALYPAELRVLEQANRRLVFRARPLSKRIVARPENSRPPHLRSLTAR